MPDGWANERRARIARVSSIEVAVEALEVQIIDGDRASATFVQRYADPGYRDASVKTLNLERVGLGWRIVGEGSRPL